MPSALRNPLHLSIRAPPVIQPQFWNVKTLMCPAYQCMQNGQQYKPHEDYFHDKVNARPENGGQRIATVLMYLCVS